MGGIVWIASYPKSGNTWTRNFLHNLILGPEGDRPHDINAMNALTTYELAGHWYQDLLDKPLEEASTEDIMAVRHQAQAKIAAETDDLVFVKTHNALVAQCGVSMVNPRVTAGAIYVLRNPLDVAISYSHHLDTTIDKTIERMETVGLGTANHKQGVFEAMGTWSEHVYSWTKKKHQGMHVMRYEDMLSDPEKEFGALVDFLLLPRDKQRLRDAIELSSFKRLKAAEDVSGFEEKPKEAKRFFREGRSDQWQEILTDTQVKRIIDAHREQMVRFNYIPDGY